MPRLFGYNRLKNSMSIPSHEGRVHDTQSP